MDIFTDPAIFPIGEKLLTSNIPRLILVVFVRIY